MNFRQGRIWLTPNKIPLGLRSLYLLGYLKTRALWKKQPASEWTMSGLRVWKKARVW
jgi:hypothetical protein